MPPSVWKIYHLKNITLEQSNISSKGVAARKFEIRLLAGHGFYDSKHADQNKMMHNAASHLGIKCLLSSNLKNIRQKWCQCKGRCY